MQDAFPRASRDNTTWRNDALPLAIVLVLAGMFFFSFFNRFAGIRSGNGEFSGGIGFLLGSLPYRDYYSSGPPLNQLKSALELAVFGKTLFATRLCAVVERLGIAALLYAWLRRTFSPLAAAIAALVTIIVSAGDRTDPLASYNHDAILFAMLCGFAASLSLSARRTPGLLWGAALAGTAGGFSALTKQTVGLGTAFAVLIVAGAACLARFGPRKFALWMPAYLAGFALPVLLVAWYLRRLGILAVALRILFVSGPAAKAGRPFDFVAREIHIGVDNWPWVLLAVIALSMSALAVWRSLRSPQAFVSATSRTWLGFAASGCIVIGIAGLLALTPLPAIQNFSKAAVYYTFAGISILGIAAIVCALRFRADSFRLWQFAIFAAVGWSVAATQSLSFPAFEAMTLPGLGVLLAAAVDGVRRGRIVLYSLLAITVFFQVREKFDLPFAFQYEDEPAIRFARAQSTLPPLRGMRLPPETVRLLDTTTTLIRTHVPPNGTFATYPEMSIFYALSSRGATTWTGSQNIDVVPDTLAREEAVRLLQAQPPVLVYARPTLEQIQQEESLWRNGRPSGQRSLIAAMDCLASHYQLIDTFQITPADDPIRLYLRPGPATAAPPCPALQP